MPNIFGKNPDDYRYIRVAKEKGRYDSMKSALAAQGRVHNFDALGSFSKAKFNDQELGAQAIGYVTNNLQAIQSEIEEILYTDFRLDEFIPFEENIPEGAASYAYRTVDRQGIGSEIDHHGAQAQEASIGVQLTPYAIRYGGIRPSWTVNDLRRAMFAGIPLDTETIRAGVEGSMDHIEQVGISGDTNHGIPGIINMTNVTAATAAGTYAARTADQIVTELQGQITNIIIDTEEVFGRVIKSELGIYAPISQASVLANRAYGDNRDKSIWDYLSENNDWTDYTGKPIKLIRLKELMGAGAGGTNRILLGFPYEKRVWEFAMPISPRVITTVNTGYKIEAPIEYSYSGVNEKRTSRAMRYLDGV